MIQPNRNSVESGSLPHGLWQRLEAIQFLPERCEFVSFQLENLTPPWLHVLVQTPVPIDLKQGVRIDYRLILHGGESGDGNPVTAVFVTDGSSTRAGGKRLLKNGTESKGALRFAGPSGSLLADESQFNG